MIRYIQTQFFIIAIFICGVLNIENQINAQTLKASLVLYNGKIVTMNEENPEAQAIAVVDDRIIFVGTNNEAEKYIDDQTSVIDLNGKLAVPGFIEGHAHFMNIGQANMLLDLTTAQTWEQIVALVAEAVQDKPAGTWILGRGWHQEKWIEEPAPNVEGYPVHVALSKVSPNHPVHLKHASGHMSIANAKAIELAGINRETPNPSGGEILKDSLGNLTGVFRETAQSYIYKAIDWSTSGQTDDQKKNRMKQQLQSAMEECRANGITSFQDAGSTFEWIELFREYAKRGELTVRLWVMTDEANREVEKYFSSNPLEREGNFLTVRAVKRFMDGALGAHGAWLLEPYSDLQDSTGHQVTPIENIKKAAEIAVKNDLQLCVHAIGDRANREVLDIMEETFNANPGKKDLRWRIEHAQHIHPNDIPRFAQLGVIASMQAVHCTSDAPFVVERLGEKRARESAYPWRSLLDHGAVVINGTDAPVEDINPIHSFYASVTRKLADGTEFFPEQSMTREEALRSYTLDAAYAAFEEDSKGSLEPGKLADMTVLSNDIMTVPEEEILETEVLYTIVGGKIVYKK